MTLFKFRKNQSGLKIFLTLMLLLTLIPVSASVAGEARENQIREISHKLRCPTCQAMSVKESEAGLSLNMKSKIREMLEEGASEEEILDFFVERYGEWILREPPKKGFNLFLWLAPLVLILLIGFFVIRSLIRKTKNHSEIPAIPLSSQERAQIEKDLSQFESD
jgi:cytochrome c-type biogenesis protein CcmH